MRTIILPGYSPKNLDWAMETQAELQTAGLESMIHEWKHWETKNEEDFAHANEVENVLKEIGEEQVNIVAKSIGTLVAMLVVAHARDMMNKIVLCGIPIKGDQLTEKDKTNYDHLTELDTSQVLVIQNEKDPLSSFTDAADLVHSINSDISIVSKPRSDHHYPYYQDFISFLSQE